MRVFTKSRLLEEKIFYRGISFFQYRLNFFPRNKLIWIFFPKSVPTFLEVTQGFNDTRSRGLENRGSESLRQLLAIKTPARPRRGAGSGQAVGSVAMATDAFGHPSLISNKSWSCLIAAHSLSPTGGQCLQHFKALSPSETPGISNSQLLIRASSRLAPTSGCPPGHGAVQGPAALPARWRRSHHPNVRPSGLNVNSGFDQSHPSKKQTKSGRKRGLIMLSLDFHALAFSWPR